MRLLRASVAAVTCVALLASCSDDGEPRSDPTRTASVTTPTDESSSPAAFDPRRETAKQFIRRWVALIDQTQATGRTAAYRQISGPNCRSCKRFVRDVEELHAADGYVRAGRTKVVRIERDGSAQWTVTLRSAPGEYKRSATDSVTRTPGGEHQLVAYLFRSGEGWRLTEYLDAD